MHGEAFVVIGLFILVLGVLLFVPAWIWVKRKQRAEPGKQAKVKLSKVGWTLIWVMLTILIGGLLMDYMAPESLMGRFVKMPVGRFLYLVIVAVVFWIVEAALKARGIKLTKEN
jgi:small-conductance mechanosensitive channel